MPAPMRNTSRRRVGELQRGVFRILLDQPEGLAAKEIIKRMEQAVPPILAALFFLRSLLLKGRISIHRLSHLRAATVLKAEKRPYTEEYMYIRYKETVDRLLKTTPVFFAHNHCFSSKDLKALRPHSPRL